MRGKVDPQSDMLALLAPAPVVPQEHPLRRRKQFVDAVLKELCPEFDAMYAELGRPSIPPERLLKAKLLQALLTIRSENLSVESLHYHLLFRWFLDLNMTDAIWDNSTFSKNRERPLKPEVAEGCCGCVVELAHENGWGSDEPFTVDGTWMEAWASLKSFPPKKGPTDPKDNDPGNTDVDFKGQKRSTATHQSTTDPEAQWMRQGKGKEAKGSFGMHALMENRNGGCVQVMVSASPPTETSVAAEGLARQVEIAGRTPATVGGGTGYHNAELVGCGRDREIAPHVAEVKNRKGGGSGWAHDGEPGGSDQPTDSQTHRGNIWVGASNWWAA